ncbi:MAG TPA: class I SAM-dependent methyltransferase [Chitinophagales bacterium]|nr:class I SAM-dependent methyltransferase [Chitinophagales bacterium]
MSKYFYKAIRFLFRFPIFWNLIKPIINFFKNLEVQKMWTDRAPLDKMIKEQILVVPEVKNGFFKGMRYPGFQAAGSAIYPKFIGSYENELNPIIEKAIQKQYDTIIDVGCAEGYYANGLARLLPNATVYAYDTVQYARNLCQQIATINEVQDRVFIKGTLNASELSKFDFTNKNAFIISDCEGFEKQLFTNENIHNLKNCDVLIETHDLFDLTISAYLINLFKDTHQTPLIIASLDDNKKAQTYHFPETEKLDLKTKKIIFSEERKAIMEWLFFQKM